MTGSSVDIAALFADASGSLSSRGPRSCSVSLPSFPRVPMPFSRRFIPDFLFILIVGTAALQAAPEAPRGTSPTRSPIRVEVVINRADGNWESQQVQETCILPNPRDPSKLVMFCTGVPTSDRVTCAVGKAWANVSKFFTWYQDKANPIFGPTGEGWDAKTMRLDAVLHIPEKDAYYIYCSATTGNIQVVSAWQFAP